MTIAVPLPPPTPDKFGASPAAFDAAVGAFLGWMSTSEPLRNAQNLENNELAAATAASALVARNFASAKVWNAGTNYAFGEIAVSPVDWVVYRRTVAGITAADPSIDPGLWTRAIGNQTINTNTAHGESALRVNTTGRGNTAMGDQALRVNTTGGGNSAFGRSALWMHTTGGGNSAFGEYAHHRVVSGSFNTACGAYASFLYEGSNNTAVGYEALRSNKSFSNCSGLGAHVAVTGSNQVQLGDQNTTTYVYGTVQNRSDLRDKVDVRDTVLGLSFIAALRPVDYKWDLREDYKPAYPADFGEAAPGEDASAQELADFEAAKAAHEASVDAWLVACKHENLVRDGSKKRVRYHHGLIAQEVQAVMTAQGVDFGGYQNHTINGGEDVLSIGYDELVGPLIKAVQELAAQNAALVARVTALEAAP